MWVDGCACFFACLFVVSDASLALPCLPTDLPIQTRGGQGGKIERNYRDVRAVSKEPDGGEARLGAGVPPSTTPRPIFDALTALLRL